MHIVVAKRMNLDCTNQIDHEDNDKLNCRRDNLRPATNGQNRANSRLNVNNTSGIKGVHWDSRKEKWIAQINVQGRKLFLGGYDELHKAKAAYVWAANFYHQEFARP